MTDDERQSLIDEFKSNGFDITVHRSHPKYFFIRITYDVTKVAFDHYSKFVDFIESKYGNLCSHYTHNTYIVHPEREKK